MILNNFDIFPIRNYKSEAEVIVYDTINKKVTDRISLGCTAIDHPWKTSSKEGKDFYNTDSGWSLVIAECQGERSVSVTLLDNDDNQTKLYFEVDFRGKVHFE